MTDIFQEWLLKVSNETSLPAHVLSRFRSLEHLLDEAHRESLNLQDGGETWFALIVVKQLAAYGWCLLDSGYVYMAYPDVLKKGHREDDTLWALKGCARLAILRGHEGGYYHIGSCWPQTRRFLTEDFFLSRDVQEITLI